MSPTCLLTLLWIVAPAAPADSAQPAPAPDYRSPGPYPVGVRTVVLVDAARRDEFTRGPRTLVTEVWYPAEETARGRPRMRFGEFFGPYRKEGARALRKDLEDIERSFTTLAVRDAPLARGRWPLLIFSHGNGGYRHQNVFQMDHLASHGYVVASPDHTGNSRLSPLPGAPAKYDRDGKGQSARDRPLDVRFLLAAFLSGEGEARWLREALDAEAIGVLGHSFGGYTAVRVAEEDPRVKAVLAMTVAFMARPTAVPTMVMLGAQDRTVGRAGNFASRGYYLGLSGPRHLFVLKRGGHFTFTDMSVIRPDFGDGVGRGKGLDGEEMDFVPVPLGKEIINAYTLAFFQRYLRGDAAAAAFLARNHYPGELEWWCGAEQIPPGPGGGTPGTEAGTKRTSPAAGSGTAREAKP